MAYGNFGRSDRGERRYGERRESSSFGGGYSGGGGSSSGGGGSSFMRRAPVKEGEELDVKIEAIASKGDGIAKKEGFVIFVPKTKIGDEVKIRISKVMRRVAFADVIGQGSAAPKPEGEAPAEETAHEESGSEESSEESESNQDSEDFGEEEQ